MSSKHKKDKQKVKGKVMDFGPSCYSTHKAMPLGSGVVYGGSAHTPKVKDADIYVALESSARFTLTDPWEGHQITNVRFSIPDSYPPTAQETPRFKKMVTYLCNQLQAGKKIHVGCIGGHGRTGTVLAAMAAEMGHKDAVQYVRGNYCEKAVESSEQVDFLMKEYGVDYAQANKIYVPLSSGLWTGTKWQGNADWESPLSKTSKSVTKALSLPFVSNGSGTRQVHPLPDSPRSLWKKST